MHDHALEQDSAFVHNACQAAGFTTITDCQQMRNVTISMPVALCDSVCDRQARWLANITIVIDAVSGSAAAAANTTSSVFAPAAAACMCVRQRFAHGWSEHVM